MSQNLRLLLDVIPEEARFNESAGLLALAARGEFVVSLKQYRDAKGLLDNQIHEKVMENQREAAKFQALYDAKRADGIWSAQDARSHAANQVERDRTFDRIQGEVNDLNAQKASLLRSYNDVNWCWQVVGTGLNAAQISHNASFDRGIRAEGNTISFPKLLEGGGLCWLEVFREGTDPATGTVPNGMYVQATGTPDILRCEWTDYEFNPITGGVGFGSEVLLHVYTGGLFGQEISVGLVDRDLFSFNDSLPIANATAFIREVNVYEEKPFEEGKTDVEGELNTAVGDATSGARTKNFVQKSIVQVLIDPAWEAIAGSTLKIFPIVKSVRDNREFEGFERAYLEVNNFSPKTEDPNVVYTNNPVLVGEIETDAAVFHPCKYEQITFAPVPQTAQSPAIVIFDKSRQEAQVLTVPIICPDTDHMQDYQVELAELSVTECRFANTPQSHQNSTFTVVHPPENFRVTSQSNERLGFQAAFHYHPSNDNIPEHFSIKMLEYIWPARLPRDNRQPLNIIAQTCRYTRTVSVLPYPDVKWTLDFRFGMKGPRVSTHTNLPIDDRRRDTTTGSRNSRYSTAQDDARRAGTVNRRGFMVRSEGMELEFQLSLGADYNKGEKIELAAKYEAKISRFLEKLISLKNSLDTVTNIKAADKGFRNSVRGLGQLLKAPVRGSIDYPVISIGGSWQAAISNQLEVYTTGSLLLKFTPLIKASVSLDIIAAASYVPALRPAVMAVERAFAAGGGEINFLLTLFGQVDVNFEYNLSDSGGSNLNLTGVLGLKLELSANLRVNINAVFFQIEGEASVSGVVVTSIEPRASIGHDNGGTFVDAHCDFKGIKIVATLSGTGGGGSIQYEDTYVVLEEKPDFFNVKGYIISAS